MKRQGREQWIGSKKHMSARHERAIEAIRQRTEEVVQRAHLLLRQHGEARQRLSLGAIERRRNAPDATAPRAQLAMILFFVFDHPIRRIGNDGMNGILGQLGEPLNRIRQHTGRSFGKMRATLLAMLPHSQP